MMTRVKHPKLQLLVCLACMALLVLPRGSVHADELTAKQVSDSIDKARRYLLRAQDPDGSWSRGGGLDATYGGIPYAIGVSSLVMLALFNSGMTLADPEIQRGLNWLRKQTPSHTYDISLMIQALAAAKDGVRDLPRVVALVQDLEELQLRNGPNAGSWSYSRSQTTYGGDRSNGQFAVLALRDAQEMGVPVSNETWLRARNHWIGSQNRDGGWGYSSTEGSHRKTSYGSMTVAGIATLVITEGMLKSRELELNSDGTPVCCGEHKIDQPLEDACRWLGDRFQVRQNPGEEGNFVLYYLYGLERAGRFSGRRFFINGRGQKHDWYRAGAEFLVSQQGFEGDWKRNSLVEDDPSIGTSFALMFLSKGLAPVLINKLEYGPRDPDRKEVVGSDWNLHQDDVRNLTQHISSLAKWPRLLNWQTVDVSQATVADLLQAPIVFISGSEAPQLNPQELALLKEYILQGGFIFVVNNCNSALFDEGFRDLARQMYPAPETQLTKLTGNHPVFRSEYNLLDDRGEPKSELWGIDVGCRTSIMYSPHDLSCLWDKWTSFKIPGRSEELVELINRANQVGVNVVAYVTGREILNKFQQDEQISVNPAADKIERDLLQISTIRYRGDWDAAPQALKNLLFALNRTSGLPVSAKQRELTLVDPNLFRYPIAYMHGRTNFALDRNEQDKLREYLQQGGVLFSDACCGAPQYDRSFRQLIGQLFPDSPLKRIPSSHEMFSAKIGYELKSVKRRERDVDNASGAISVSLRETEPFLEGVEINGRYVVIYSKFDISCALERQASVACVGYVHEDAVKIGINVILYALLQ
jgi:hypothetical protein